jgi:malonyl-CoA/methylmalonyl-CoA synthetase
MTEEDRPEDPGAADDLRIVGRAWGHGARTAVLDGEGSFTYEDLLRASEGVARALLGGRDDLDEGRVAFLVPPGFQYVAVQWGIWRAGGVAVPMAVSHPPRELAYVVEDADPVAVVVHPSMRERIPHTQQLPVWSSEALTGAAPGASAASPLPRVVASRRAMMLYTSGTTGRPKGVVTTHANIEAQVRSLVEAWEWTHDDQILLVLPLHHVHGIVNVLSCALWSGARCSILPGFDAEETWRRIARGDLTLFMAVPTIYARLLAAWEQAPPEEREAWSAGCRRMRLMVSGSAALPVSMLERWRDVSGHTLLERYGMTEIGMALSNPLEGERRPGFVGRPLPGVEVRLVGEDGRLAAEGEPGEIEVRGDTVFGEYWRRPEETASSFSEGWFHTGDIAVMEDGAYRILGRSSVDIIKTGGYKVSALEIEEVLRTHPAVADCAVVGVPDPEWGERVAAALVPARGKDAPEADILRPWLKERLAPYKVPSLFLAAPELPRNAMGKVTKPAVRGLFGEGKKGADPA